MIKKMELLLGYLKENLKVAIYRSYKKIGELLEKLIHKPIQEDSGFGVVMNDEQYEKFNAMLTTVADETSRREKRVEDNLEELKKFEYVKTYTAFVRDITMAITSLNSVTGAEQAKEQLLKTLGESSSILKEVGYEKNMQEISEIQVQVESSTKELHKEIKETERN
jgi:hypothetical protein